MSPQKKRYGNLSRASFFSIGIRLFSKGEHPIEIHNDWPGSLGSADTAIRFCPMNVFVTLEQSGK